MLRSVLGLSVIGHSICAIHKALGRRVLVIWVFWLYTSNTICHHRGFNKNSSMVNHCKLGNVEDFLHMENVSYHKMLVGSYIIEITAGNFKRHDLS